MPLTILIYGDCMYVPHIMIGLERMLDYRGVGLERFHYISFLGGATHLTVAISCLDPAGTRSIVPSYILPGAAAATPGVDSNILQLSPIREPIDLIRECVIQLICPVTYLSPHLLLIHLSPAHTWETNT